MKAERRWTWAAAALGMVAYWGAASLVLGAPEPWDSAHYPLVLVGALLLAVAAGLAWRAHAWRWGLIVMLAQLPVMLVRPQVGSLWAVGLLFLALECLVAMAVAATAGWLGSRSA